MYVLFFKFWRKLKLLAQSKSTIRNNEWLSPNQKNKSYSFPLQIINLKILQNQILYESLTEGSADLVPGK